MSIIEKTRLLQTSMLTGLMMSVGGIAYAQTAEETAANAVELIDEEVVDNYEPVDDEVVVTGSRLKKDTFSSIAPLQVISTEIAAEQGLFNPVEILQSSSTASGQQIDSTFQGFVLDNGPGSETIDLRGLGASRTLVLLNSRRMAPAGVEGAPTQPSINLIPRTMVDRYDLLTDGASSVYGSDAVAGVINVILKNDFDGLEVDAFVDSPEQGAGQDYTLGANYGVNNDRGYIGGAIEFRHQDAWTTGDRDFLSGCETYREITDTGEIRTVDITDQYVASQLGLTAPQSECRPTRLTQRFIAGSFGSIYYQPEIGNTGVAGFSESGLFGVPVDGNGDGVVDVNFADFSPNGQQSEIQNIVNEQNQISGMLAGELTFEGEANITPYFEALYTKNEIEATGGQPQLFPFVPANNPFNPCNPNAVGGTDCGLAYDGLLANPNYLSAFRSYYNNPGLSGTDNCFGLGDTAACNPFTFGLANGPIGAVRARPVIGVRGDRNTVEVDIEQTRFVGGVKGDLPFINSGSIKDFSFDISAAHSYSNGSSSRSGIRDDRLLTALGTDYATGAPTPGPCIGLNGNPVGGGCVPVNLFAPSLYTNAAGADFATQAERDYVFDSRDFDTYYAQTVLDGIIQGDLFTLPGGDVSILLGAQWRKDEINSQPDDIARDGLFFGFFSDGGAVGEKVIKEAYGEVSLPLGTGKPFFREFNVDLSGRLTDDEFYGTNETYSIKAGYRPVDSLLLRGTFGTSFRAPNLRENFLLGQSGFNTLFDPCAVPDGAFNPLTGGYDASQDGRSQIVLNNCSLAGVDPTSFRANQADSYSVEINTGGTLELDPERSESLTLGFAFEQPFTDAFDAEIGVTYYDIDISQTIVETSANFLINDCYSGQPNLGSAFCSRVLRDPNTGLIDVVNAGFVNRDQETARGLDFSVDLGKDEVNLFNKSVDFGLSARFNRLLERKTVDVIGDLVDEEEFKGDFGFSKWRGSATATAAVDKFRFAWTSRYISGVETDEEDRNSTDFGNFVDGDPVVTCLGASEGDVNCRGVFFAKDYLVHNASMSFREDTWSVIVGVNNVFDKAPPLVDPSEVFSVSNVPIGSGYDLEGREYFIRLNKRFN